MKAIVAIDSMKGCLTSEEAGMAFAEGLRGKYPGIYVKVLPVADGGEGTADCIARYSEGYRRMENIVCGPEGRPVTAAWWINTKEKSACIDMASAAGLPLLSPERRNPMHTTSFGVGQLLEEARKRGAKSIILGLGGSATVDGGLGALQALGARILDLDGYIMPTPFTGKMLTKIADIDTEEMKAKWQGTRLTLACDVTSRFTGENGAAHIFAPQKGATPEETEILDAGLLNLKRIIQKKIGIDLDMTDCSGAAGGCGGGLSAFLGAEIKTGSDLVLEVAEFDSHIIDADFVATGEGCADRQTLMHKLPGVILRHCKNAGVKTILVAGRIEDRELLSDAGFDRIIDINSSAIIRFSCTEGCDPLNPAVAKKRLKASGQYL